MMDSIFLGDSQTFLGTIATLTILCVFSEKNSGNFIISVLDGIKERIKVQIEQLKTNTNMSISLPKSYDLLQYFLGRSNIESDLNNEGLKLLRDISAKQAELKTQYVMNVEFKKDALMGQTRRAKEQFLAPLYTFLFCIVIFVFDELLRFPFSSKEWMISGMALFIFYSYLFWTIVWINFFVTHRVGYNKREKPFIPRWLMEEWNRVCRWTRNFGCSKTFFLRTSLCVLIVLLCIFCAHSYSKISAGIMILGLSMPIFIKGYSRINYLFNEGDYSPLFLVGHFAALFVLSFLLVSEIHLFVHYDSSYSNILIPYEDFFWMKCSALGFALFNGIIFPFLFPFLCYSSLYTMAKKNARKTKKEQKRLLKEFELQLDSLCAKIPSPISEPQKVKEHLHSEQEENNDLYKYCQEYDRLKGVKIVDFCQQNGLDVYTFKNYRKEYILRNDRNLCTKPKLL